MGAGGGFREQPFKTLLYVLLAALIVIWMAAALRHAAVRSGTLPPGMARLAAGALLAACVVGGVLAARTPDLVGCMLANRNTLDGAHFWITVAILLAAVATTLHPRDELPRAGLLITGPL